MNIATNAFTIVSIAVLAMSAVLWIGLFMASGAVSNKQESTRERIWQTNRTFFAASVILYIYIGIQLFKMLDKLKKVLK